MHYDENPPRSYDERMMLDGLLSQYLVAIMYKQDVYLMWQDSSDMSASQAAELIGQIDREIEYIRHSFQIERFRKY